MAEILIVDDNPADCDLASDVFSRSRRNHHIRAVADGVAAMAVLHREGKYAGARLPDLVVLDLNLPGKDGREVLAEVKADAELRETPVVIFSSSQARQDIVRCYQLGANGYVNKPGTLQDYISAVTCIGDFWFGFARLPREED
jgi:CheY-like chemotaxis protein